jgi:hypothetical protein
MPKQKNSSNQYVDLLGEISNQIPSFHASEIAIAEAILLNPAAAVDETVYPVQRRLIKRVFFK